MTGLLKRFGRARGGAAATEFALVSPFLLMLLFGVFEYGRYLWTVNALKQTATLTARCMGLQMPDNVVINGATVHGCAPNTAPSGSPSYAYSAATAVQYGQRLAAGYGIPLTASNFTLNNAADCASVSGFSQAQITYAFTSYVPDLIPALAQGLTIRESACFPNQG